VKKGREKSLKEVGDMIGSKIVYIVGHFKGGI
jgi:hypothetical protein